MNHSGIRMYAAVAYIRMRLSHSRDRRPYARYRVVLGQGKAKVQGDERNRDRPTGRVPGREDVELCSAI